MEVVVVHFIELFRFSVSRNRGKAPNNHDSMNPRWDMNLALLNTKQACYYSSQLLTNFI